MQAKEQNNSPIKQRILSFAGTLGISKRDFYAKIGVSRGTLESKTGITEDEITKFIATYPQVSIEWLMTGEGDMLKTKRTPENLQAQESTNSDYKDSKNQTLGQDIPPLILDRLLNTIAEKDAIIREQAEELGRLREQIEQFKKGRGHSASDVNTSEIANVG